MPDNESEYRRTLQSTANFVVAFFERPEEFPGALEDIRLRLIKDDVQPDKSCVLYRTRCKDNLIPRFRIWSHLVAFNVLSLPEQPCPPWIGLDWALKRPMTELECRAFLMARLYEVFEIRVSKRMSRTLQPGPV